MRVLITVLLALLLVVCDFVFVDEGPVALASESVFLASLLQPQITSTSQTRATRPRRRSRRPRRRATTQVSCPAVDARDTTQEEADVLYIGDSHSTGCFGETLYSSLRGARGAGSPPLRVRSAATCGSATGSWLRTSGNCTSCGYRTCSPGGACVQRNLGTSPSFESLLRQSGPGPRATVIALGSNMLNASLRSTERVLADVDRLIAQVPQGSQCIWVGPPQAREIIGTPPRQWEMSVAQFDSFNQQLAARVRSKGCRFVDSADKSRRETITDPMGLHYTCSAAADWGRRVASEVAPIVAQSLASSGAPASRAPAPGNATGTRAQ